MTKQDRLISFLSFINNRRLNGEVSATEALTIVGLVEDFTNQEMKEEEMKNLIFMGN